MPGSSRLESLILGCISIVSNRSSEAGSNSFLGSLGRRLLDVKPRLEMLGRQHHRHAVVQRRDHWVGGTGEDHDRVDLSALLVAPALIESGKGDQLALPRAEQEGTARALGSSPFIEAVGGNEAAAPAHGIAEGGLGQYLLRTRVDQGGKRLRILDEGGQQAPAHESEAAHPFPVARHHGDRLRRRDIVAGGEIRRVGVTEIGPHGLRRRGQTIARAHSSRVLVTLWQS